MKMRKLLIIVCLALISIIMIEQTLADDKFDFTENIGTNGVINWTEGTITVKGSAAKNPRFNSNPAQQRLMAERGAEADAYRHLAEIVSGVRVSSDTYLKNMILENDEVRTRVEGFIKNFKVLKKDYENGMATVTLIAPLNGQGGLADVIIPDNLPRKKPPYPQVGEIPTQVPIPAALPPNIAAALKALEERIAAIERFLADKFGYVPPGGMSKPSSLVTTSPALGQIYTGLIVDAARLNVKPAMAPKIIDESGKEIYGTGYVSRKYAIQQGIVGYSKNVEKAKQNERVANKALVVKGIKTVGANNADIVISTHDAQILLGMKDNLSFLDKCRVMIVLD